MAKVARIDADHIRHCRARRVKTWCKKDAKQRIYKGKCEGEFRLLSSGNWPTNETWFDVVSDGAKLYVSVLAQESGNTGLLLDGFARDADVIEILIDPLCDRVGYLQYAAGSDGMRADYSHWPYRDPALDRYRDGQWDVAMEEEQWGPDVVRSYFFEIDLGALRGLDRVGFNVGRSQNRASENSTWNFSSGTGFCDAGCFGRLWLKAPPVSCGSASTAIEGTRLKAVTLNGVRARKGARLSARVVSPSGKSIAEWPARAIRSQLVFRSTKNIKLTEPGRYRILLTVTTAGRDVPVEPNEFFFDHCGTKSRTVQFQGTYDWPDNIGNVVYSPRDLEDEMKWYKDCGLDRICWIDYEAETWMGTGRKKPPQWGARIRRSYDLFGEDFLFGAARAARKADQEFVTIFKPFDLGVNEPFVKEHRECQIRRNPSWSVKKRRAIASIRLYQNDDSPFPFKPGAIKVWQSHDNKTYRLVRGPFRARSTCVDRTESAWGLLRPQPCDALPSDTRGSGHRVRRISIDGLNMKAPYVAITCDACDASVAIRNRQYRLVEMMDEDGTLHTHVSVIEATIPSGGFDFGPRVQNAPSWTRSDIGMDKLVTIRGESVAIGVSTRLPNYLPGFLEPSFEIVRSFWLAKLRRGLEAGADGISVRIAHHVGCVDWLAYMFAEPVLEEFRRRTGRDPEPCNDDFTLIRLIRGDFYTQFVRDASVMAHAVKKKFLHHIENRMLAPAEGDCYCQIYWDWPTWIQERLVDEIDLKYIGPDHTDCYRHIVPLARRHGVKVNWITAHPEPRSYPRSIDECPSLIDRAIEGGLDGINLYELWLYRRMTDCGMPMTRGGGEAIIRNMRKRLDERQLLVGR